MRIAQRQGHRERGADAVRVIDGLEGAVMEIRDLLGEVQAYARAGDGALSLIEQIEDMLQRLLVHPAAGVPDLDGGRVGPLRHGDGHASSGWSVFQKIGVV